MINNICSSRQAFDSKVFPQTLQNTTSFITTFTNPNNHELNNSLAYALLDMTCVQEVLSHILQERLLHDLEDSVIYASLDMNIPKSVNTNFTFPVPVLKLDDSLAYAHLNNTVSEMFYRKFYKFS